jgi:hypothetical protein
MPAAHSPRIAPSVQSQRDMDVHPPRCGRASLHRAVGSNPQLLYLSSWRDLQRRSQATAFWLFGKPEITPLPIPTNFETAPSWRTDRSLVGDLHAHMPGHLTDSYERCRAVVHRASRSSADLLELGKKALTDAGHVSPLTGGCRVQNAKGSSAAGCWPARLAADQEQAVEVGRRQRILAQVFVGRFSGRRSAAEWRIRADQDAGLRRSTESSHLVITR